MQKKILISGASGLIGKALVNALKDNKIYTLVRKEPKNESEIFWDIEKGILDSKKLEGFDIVIHLSGENIASGRWSEAQKKKIIDSRVLSTRLLSHALSKVSQKPSHYLQASATGYYGLRGDERLDEESSPGTGFLPDVCVAWEQETAPLFKAGIPVTFLRTGIVLSLDGGALAKMITPFKLGLGGVVGDGTQYMSWIDLDDWMAALFYILEQEIKGVVNLVSPFPVTNKEFTKTLSDVVKRPAIFKVPSFALKMALGEMAKNILLGSTRVYPTVLMNSGFRFEYPHLQESLIHFCHPSSRP